MLTPDKLKAVDNKTCLVWMNEYSEIYCMNEFSIVQGFGMYLEPQNEINFQFALRISRTVNYVLDMSKIYYFPRRRHMFDILVSIFFAK